ncbi:Serine/threonine-protein kinase PAK 1 [Perkinsela sp. CCAP 1560/4]|nr:Serine/threonine-protein kinase PAK 1 [Perkinsela sp. CCAP 1560/4]|eukprot:KNH04120.1 Serine/threonine-protein kinase PAK 1 [Perkinsela sp. CCAP 1560/4]
MPSTVHTAQKSKSYKSFERFLNTNIEGDEEWVREITRLGQKHIAKEFQLAMAECENAPAGVDVSRIEDDILTSVLCEAKNLIPGEVKMKAWEAAVDSLRTEDESCNESGEITGDPCEPPTDSERAESAPEVETLGKTQEETSVPGERKPEVFSEEQAESETSPVKLCRNNPFLEILRDMEARFGKMTETGIQ